MCLPNLSILKLIILIYFNKQIIDILKINKQSNNTDIKEKYIAHFCIIQLTYVTEGNDK